MQVEAKSLIFMSVASPMAPIKVPAADVESSPALGGDADTPALEADVDISQVNISTAVAADVESPAAKAIGLARSDTSRRMSVREHAKLRRREEVDRRKNHKYSTDVSNLKLFETAFSWRDTTLPTVMGRADVWLAMALHLTLFAIDQAYREGLLDGSRERADRDGEAFVSPGTYFVKTSVDFKYIGACIWIMVFSLAFWVSQCYTRYLRYYDATCGLGGTLMEVSQRLSVDLESQPEARWRIVRYLTASVMLVFGDTQVPSDPSPAFSRLRPPSLTCSSSATRSAARAPPPCTRSSSGGGSSSRSRTFSATRSARPTASRLRARRCSPRPRWRRSRPLAAAAACCCRPGRCARRPRPTRPSA